MSKAEKQFLLIVEDDPGLQKQISHLGHHFDEPGLYLVLDSVVSLAFEFAQVLRHRPVEFRINLLHVIVFYFSN